MNFGDVAVGMRADQVAHIKNVGSNNCFYAIERPMEGLTVTPSEGCIPPNGRHELVISLSPTSVIQYETNIIISVRGGKPHKLPISAQVEMPKVEIETPLVEFGSQFVGEPASLPVVVRNLGKITATLLLDLSRHPELDVDAKGSELAVEPYQTVNTSKLTRASSRLSIMSSSKAKQGRGRLNGGRGGGDEDPFRFDDEDEDSENDGDTHRVGAAGGGGAGTGRSALLHASIGGSFGGAGGTRRKVYTVTIPAGSGKSSFLLTFTPQLFEAYRTEVPVSLHGLAPIRLTATGLGLKPRLVLSTNKVDFGECIVQDQSLLAVTSRTKSDQLSGQTTARKLLHIPGTPSIMKQKSPYFADITLSNNDTTSPLSWDLDLNHPMIEKGTFAIEPTGGFLDVRSDHQKHGHTTFTHINMFICTHAHIYMMHTNAHTDAHSNTHVNASTYSNK